MYWHILCHLCFSCTKVPWESRILSNFHLNTNVLWWAVTNPICLTHTLILRAVYDQITYSSFKEGRQTVIPRLLVVTLHVGMTRKQDGGYTQWTQLQWNYLRQVKLSFTQWWALAYKLIWMPASIEDVANHAIWQLRGSLDENAGFSSLS